MKRANEPSLHGGDGDPSTKKRPPSGKAIQMVRREGDRYQVVPEARKFLLSLSEEPLVVLIVAGAYRTGKSFFLNSLFKERGIFEVGPTVNPCTHGLWIARTTLTTTSGHTMIVIDTEGLGATMGTTNDHDLRLFALALLLSSFFVFNSVGMIDEKNLENLSLVGGVSKMVRAAAAPDQPISEYMPRFLWLLRDFSLDLRALDHSTMTEKQYLERALAEQPGVSSRNELRSGLRELFVQRDCLTLVRPATDEKVLQQLDQAQTSQIRTEFRKGLERVRSYILQNATPKTLCSQQLRPREFVSLLELYVHHLNEGACPSLQDTWTCVSKERFTSALCESVQTYQKLLQTSDVLYDPDGTFRKGVRASDLKQHMSQVRAKVLQEVWSTRTRGLSTDNGVGRQHLSDLHSKLDDVERKTRETHQQHQEKHLSTISRHILRRSWDKILTHLLTIDDNSPFERVLSDFSSNSDVVSLVRENLSLKSCLVSQELLTLLEDARVSLAREAPGNFDNHFLRVAHALCLLSFLRCEQGRTCNDPLPSMRSRIAELEGSLEEKSEALVRSSEKLAQIEQELAATVERASECTREQLEELEKRYAQLSEQTALELEQLRERCRDLDEARIKLELQNETQQETQSRLLRELEASQEERNALEQSLEKALASIEVEEPLSGDASINESMQMEELERPVFEQLRVLAQRLEEFESVQEENSLERKRLEGQLLRMENEKTSLKSEKSQIADLLSAERASTSRLKQEIKSQEIQHKENIDVLRTQMQDRERILQAERGQLSDAHQKESIAAQNREHALQVQIAGLETRVDELQKRIRSLGDELSAAKEEQARVNRESWRQKTELDLSQRTNSQLRSDLNRERTKTRDLEQKLHSERMNARIEGLQSRLEKVKPPK